MPKWLILRDFNLIYKIQDKNNGRINRSMMSRFRRSLDHLEVKEIKLVGKKFTSSNNLASPTMSRIDRSFCTPAWEKLYDKPILHTLSSSTFDHCPILVAVDVSYEAPQAHAIVNVALHQEYSPGIVFIFS
jgi:hypothetical protein